MVTTQEINKIQADICEIANQLKGLSVLMKGFAPDLDDKCELGGIGSLLENLEANLLRINDTISALSIN